MISKKRAYWPSFRTILMAAFLLLLNTARAESIPVQTGYYLWNLDTEEKTATLVGYNGTEMTELSIPESVKDPSDPNSPNYMVVAIHELSGASECKNIRKVTIPTTVREITAEKTFQVVFQLEIISVRSPNPFFTSVNGALCSKDHKRLLCFPNRRRGNFNVPEGVETIGDYAFYQSKLEEVILPSSLREIGSQCFSHSSINTVICNVVSPGNLTVGQGFSIPLLLVPPSSYDEYVRTWQSVWGATVSKIEPRDKFTPASEFPKGMTFSINEGSHTATLMSVDIYMTETKDFVIPETLVYRSGNTGRDVDFTVTAIADRVFHTDKTGLTITLPRTIETIGKSCFEYDGRSDIMIINIPEDNNIQFIDEYSFYNCNLRNVCLPSIRFMENHTFYNCPSLESVSLSDYIESIPSSSFYNCPNLASIEVGAGNPYLSADSFGLFSKDKSELMMISSNAFSDEEISIPEGVRTFCIKIAFRNNPDDGSCYSINLPASLEKIYDPDIDNHYLRSVWGREFIKHFSVDPANPRLASDDGVLFDKGMKTLLLYPVAKKDKEYVVPDGVEEIVGGNFVHPYIESVTLPESLHKVGNSSFRLNAGYNSLRVVRMNSPEPPEVESGAFITRYVSGYETFDQPHTIMLVPEGSVEAYKQVEVFNQYWDIMSSIPEGIAETEATVGFDGATYYDMAGRKLENAPARGVRIIRYSDGTTKKVYTR